MKMDLELLKCVDNGHRWETIDVVKRPSIYRTRVCSNCDSLQVQWLTHEGRVISNNTQLSKEYQDASRAIGETLSDRKAAYRAEFIKQAKTRVFKKNTERTED